MWRARLFVILQSVLQFTDARNVKIAIVGGGVGGGSAAYSLRSLTSKTKATSLHIDLFNRGPIGGRTATVEIDYGGKPRLFNSGGMFINPRSSFINAWMDEFGLQKGESPKISGVSGIYDGSKIVFQKSGWYLLDQLRLLKKYGFDIFRNRRIVNSMAKEFPNVYKILRSGRSYSTIDDLILAISPKLASSLNQTAIEFLASEGFHEPMKSEFFAAHFYLEYLVPVEQMHGFVAYWVIGDGTPGFFTIKGGNKVLAESLVRNSKANVIRGAVGSVSKSGEKFNVAGEDDAGKAFSMDGYDYVILAAPLHQEQKIRIEGLDISKYVGAYKRGVLTTVKGNLRHSHFLPSEDEGEIASLIVCNASHYYSFLGRGSPVDYSNKDDASNADLKKIWQLFSPDVLTQDQLNELFSDIEDVKPVTWLPNPEFSSPPAARPAFRLSKGICYSNAIEWLASSIETATIGGRNCANMAINELSLAQMNDSTDRQEL